LCEAVAYRPQAPLRSEILLRFDYKSVNTIAILFGIVAIAAGVEIGVMILASG
jgi:hypothetical protein